MKFDTHDQQFWQALDDLHAKSRVVIDRPSGSRHPRFPHIVYPVDYGYLEDTSSMDGGGIDVWRGTASEQIIDAVICIVDLMKKDSEVKLLIGCTQQEKALIYEFHNPREYMKGLFIPRY